MRALHFNMGFTELSKSDRKWFWITGRVFIVASIQGLGPNSIPH